MPAQAGHLLTIVSLTAALDIFERHTSRTGSVPNDEQDGCRRGSAACFQRHNADATNQMRPTKDWYHNAKNARVFCLTIC
jgi:hypothetical protein